MRLPSHSIWMAAAIVAAVGLMLPRGDQTSATSRETAAGIEASDGGVGPVRNVWPSQRGAPRPAPRIPMALGTPTVAATEPAWSNPATAESSTATATPGGVGSPDARSAAAPVSARAIAAPREAVEARDPRFGIAVASGDSAAIDHALTQTRSGTWYDYGAPSAIGPAGKVHLLRVGPNALPTSYDESLRGLARAQPGSYWIVGNEPNVPGQDLEPGWGLDPTNPARNMALTYKRYRDVILGVDPTARFVVGNMLNHATTCTGCQGFPLGSAYLSSFRNAYVTLYGVEPPVDVWGLHLYVIDWWNPPMTDTAELTRNVEAFRAYVDTLPGGAEKPIWITEMGVIFGYQDYCFVNGNVSPDCRPPTTATPTSRSVTPRYAGQPAIEFPLANDSMDAYMTTMTDWLVGHSASLRIDRWFMFTNYGHPDPYTNVYAGISLMDATNANAGLSRFGQIYRSRASALPPTGTSTPTAAAGGGGPPGLPPTATPVRESLTTPTVTSTPTSTVTPTVTATFVPVSTTVPVNSVATTTVATSDGVLRIEFPAGGVAAANGTPVPVVVNLRTNPAPATIDGIARGLKAVRIDMQTQDGSQVTQLTRGIVVEFAYSDAELATRGLDASTLRVYSSNDGVTWELLAATVDPATRRVRATVNHLTTFVLAGSPYRYAVPAAPNRSGT